MLRFFCTLPDRKWVKRKSPRIQFWEGTTLPLWDGLTLINCGGHFEGGTALHWPAGANSKGPCSRATSLPWCRIAFTSALCEAIRILFRLDPPQFTASLMQSNRSRSIKFMAAGGRRTFSQMRKEQLRDLPSVICTRSVRRNSAEFQSDARTLAHRRAGSAHSQSLRKTERSYPYNFARSAFGVRCVLASLSCFVLSYERMT